MIGPGMGASAGTNSSNPPSKRALILAVVTVGIIAALALNRLGAAEVCGSNEAVEGIFVQQMVEHGKLLFALENGHSPMYKPPLFHWTATALDHLLELTKVTAFNLRLASALYAVAGVILTVRFSWDFLGASGAWLAGLILCSSYQYVEQARIGRVDMTLCFFETLALMVFMWWYAGEEKATSGKDQVEKSQEQAACVGNSRQSWLRYTLALALGLGVLAKGPVGALLPAAACGIFLIMQRRIHYLRQIAAPGPVLVAVIVGGSWYAACFFERRYAFLDRQLASENFGRFFGTLGTMPPWYYAEPLLFNSGPLSLMVPLAVLFALRTYWQNPGESERRVPLDRAARALDVCSVDAVRLFAIFWLTSLAFFTLAAYKRRSYLLPLWPPAAVMLTWWAERLFAHSRAWGGWFRGLVITLCGALIFFNAIYLPAHQVRDCSSDSVRDTAKEIDRIVGRDEPLYLYGFGEDPAPLLFYLDRAAPPIGGKLGDAPPGYVIIPEEVWRQHQQEALDLMPVFQSTSGRPPIILLRRGKALAAMEKVGNTGPSLSEPLRLSSFAPRERRNRLP
jgi:4-amino-4-deoxy-L-arabinose transferase-like glycosyltransferase